MTMEKVKCTSMVDAYIELFCDKNGEKPTIDKSIKRPVIKI